MKEYKPNNHNNQCNKNGIAQPKHTPEDDAEKGFLDKVKWVDRRIALFLFLQNPQRKKKCFCLFALCAFWSYSRGPFAFVPLDLNFKNAKPPMKTKKIKIKNAFSRSILRVSLLLCH